MKHVILFSLLIFYNVSFLFAQDTQIKGFVDVNTMFTDNKLSFNLGEQDLFINSEISDRFTFLGESVFKYTGKSTTGFEVSVERIVVKYNIKGNHNLVIGKQHTPINYWNDTYHHGRVFFPTTGRPLLFTNSIIPLHTTGIGLQGSSLGKLNFGYDLFIGNGLGSNDITDNNQFKSITAGIYIKPKEKLRIGISAYYDMIDAEDASTHHLPTHVTQDINQLLISPSFAYFGKKIELLTEATIAQNSPDSSEVTMAYAGYAYFGFKFKKKFVLYARYDKLMFDDKEAYYVINNTDAALLGLRYEYNYLTVVKLEAQLPDVQITDNYIITAQIAIGF